MPDTTAARDAIRFAYGKHRAVMEGMSMALLKMEAAGGLYRRDDDPLPYPEDSPVWAEHALDGLEAALSASMGLTDAIRAARAQVEKLQENHRG